MPSLGADMEAGTLLEWLVSPGDVVHRGDPMAVVDTDKAAIEVESFHDGVVQGFLVEPGTRVRVGAPMARMAPLPEGAPGPVAAAPTAAAPALPKAAPTLPPATAPGAARPAATQQAAPPPVRHHAAELGVDITRVHGTGPGGAVSRADVDRASARAKATGRPPTPAPGRRDGHGVSPYARRLAAELGVDLASVPARADGRPLRAEDVRAAVGRPAPVAPVAAAPVPGAGPARGTIAALMARSKREIPHYYVSTTVDMDAVVGWLRRTNRDRAVSDRIVPAAALLRATALAAREVPELNGFWVDDRFVPGEDVHLGVAVRVRHGALVAPAIRHAADLDLPTVMSRLRDLVARARAGRLTRAEMADPTLTVTDLGDQGVDSVAGVIYPPQVALLGVGRVHEQPWAVDGLLGVRPVVVLTVSGDHRATDGATGARFLNVVDRLLQAPEEL